MRSLALLSGLPITVLIFASLIESKNSVADTWSPATSRTSLTGVQEDNDYEAISLLASQAQRNVLSYLTNTASKRGHFGTKCTRANVRIRKEYGALSIQECIAYTNAVRCLQERAANSPTSFAPGARTRYDDFVATHISQSLTIHSTGTFLAWHRYYTWHYEQALINECNYTGTQPYWDWAKTARDGLTSSPIFDGTATSMSGDGAKVADQGIVVLGDPYFQPQVIVGPGTGGGCVTTGPFKNLTVNLGPGSLIVPGNVTIQGEHPLDYNPRCLRRSLTQEINTKYVNASAIKYTLSKDRISEFQPTLEGIPGSGTPGIHGGGHYTLGGDPGRDFYTSPGDPVFFLHHSQVDRIWWTWQMKDPKSRIWGDNAIHGTLTLGNKPPSANATFDTVIELGYAGGVPLPMRDLMSTTHGPFCYMYE